MSDASYDAVVIGGGHHGTIIGCYLQNAGLQTAIFERQHELGGGACSDEVILPGFICDPCAHRTRFYGHPAFSDFNLYEKGLRYFYTEAAGGMIFEDNTCYVGYPSYRVVDERTGKDEYYPEGAEKNLREIARFSERDAETAQIILERYRKKWRAAFLEWYFNPPTPWGVKDPVEQLLEDPVDGIDPIYQFMTTKQIAYDLWESDEMRTCFIKTAMSSSAVHPHDVLSIYHFLHLCGTFLNFVVPSIARGGTHSITHALQRAFSEMGGQFFVHHEVDKVIMENGRAKGIRLVDGTEVEARKLIAADVDVHQLVFRLVGEDYFSPKIIRRVRNINYDRANLYWGSVALHELPQFKAESFNPDVQRLGAGIAMGPKDPEYVEKHIQEFHEKGIPEKLHFICMLDTIWDKTRAPQGKHVALVEHHAPPARRFSEREWLRKKKEIANEIVRQWQWYAPNMTWDNVIGINIQTPWEPMQRNIDMHEGCWMLMAGFGSQMGRFRPTPELSGYRTPIENLYLCSACTHFGGGIGRSCSYNAFKVITEDFGLEKIWEQKGRPF